MGKIVEKFQFSGNLGKTMVETLIDSGASRSLIRRNIAEKLSNQFLKRPPLVLKMVNSKKWPAVSESAPLVVWMKGKYLDGGFCGGFDAATGDNRRGLPAGMGDLP